MKLWAAMILVALTAGCAVTPEEAESMLETYLKGSKTMTPRKPGRPKGHMAFRVAVSSAEGGCTSGLRVVTRLVTRMIDIVDNGGRPDKGWADQFEGLGRELVLPKGITAPLDGAVKALRSGAADPKVAKAALEALLDATEDVLDALPDEEERLDAVLALGQSPRDRTGDLLTGLYDVEPVALTRAAAVRVVADQRWPHAPSLVLRALADQAPVVRQSAVEAVGRLELGKAGKTILTLFGDTGQPLSVRRACAWALGEIGDEGAVPALIEALDDMEDDSVRNRSHRALQRITSQAYGMRKVPWERWWKAETERREN